MATVMQIGALAELVEGRARRMWPGRWLERPPLQAEAAVDVEERAALVAELAALDAADWAPLLAAVRERQQAAATA